MNKTFLLSFLCSVILFIFVNCHTLEIIDEDKCAGQTPTNVGEIWYSSYLFGNFEKVDLIPDSRDNRWCCNNSISKVKLEKSAYNVLFETLIGIPTLFIASPLIVNYRASEIYCECAKCRNPNHRHSANTSTNYRLKAPTNMDMYPSRSMGTTSSLPYTPIETKSQPTPITQLPQAPDNVENDKVYFGYDSYKLSFEAMRTIDKFILDLQAQPQSIALIKGYADQTGTVEYNDKLARKRADAVKEYIVSRGISPDRVGTSVLGSREPLVFGSSEYARKENRVVIISINGR